MSAMQPLAFQHIHVFDGTDSLSETTVIVQDGLITAIGQDTVVPADAHIIDGTGKTLLPGLIDAHTHIIFPQALQEAIIFGVTTELDMFTDFRSLADTRRQATERADMADMRSAGTLSTAPGGHGTEYGIPIPTITEPEQAQAFVDARLAEGSDYIKIIYDNGTSFGRGIPTISKETMAALVTAAHQRGKLAIVHTLTLQEARDAIEVGADGLAHLFIGQPPDAAFGDFVAAHHAFVVPTLTVLESVVGIASGSSLVNDASLAPYLAQTTIGSLNTSFTANKELNRYAAAIETIHQLKAAGVPILAGTDAPNPGTAHGVSLHRELELLVQAGLTPLAALAAATSLPATIFGLNDRGRIAPGLRADLLLVDGDPTKDILATRAIVGVWKQGIPVERQAYRASIAQQRTEVEQRPFPPGSESGLVSDFEDGTPRAAFGYGWDISTDSVRGGSSTAQYEVVPDGANGGKGSLLITGEVVANSMFSWAGAVFYPGERPWSPANLSHKTGIAFWAKGDGRTYNVTLFTATTGYKPAMVNFVADGTWRYFAFPFAQFDASIDGKELLALSFNAGPPAGRFAFQIDDVRFIAE